MWWRVWTIKSFCIYIYIFDNNKTMTVFSFQFSKSIAYNKVLPLRATNCWLDAYDVRLKCIIFLALTQRNLPISVLPEPTSLITLEIFGKNCCNMNCKATYNGDMVVLVEPTNSVSQFQYFNRARNIPNSGGIMCGAILGDFAELCNFPSPGAPIQKQCLESTPKMSQIVGNSDWISL